MVTVKNIEDVFREFARITGGEEPLVEALKFLLVEPPIWIVSYKVFVALGARAFVDKDREGDA